MLIDSLQLILPLYETNRYYVVCLQAFRYRLLRIHSYTHLAVILVAIVEGPKTLQ